MPAERVSTVPKKTHSLKCPHRWVDPLGSVFRCPKRFESPKECAKHRRKKHGWTEGCPESKTLIPTLSHKFARRNKEHLRSQFSDGPSSFEARSDLREVLPECTAAEEWSLDEGEFGEFEVWHPANSDEPSGVLCLRDGSMSPVLHSAVPSQCTDVPLYSEPIFNDGIGSDANMSDSLESLLTYYDRDSSFSVQTSDAPRGVVHQLPPNVQQ